MIRSGFTLTFTMVDGGRQCHEVTVTADGSEPVQAAGMRDGNSGRARGEDFR